MSDFESLIRAMMKNGASPEDIAKKTGDILNAVSKENEGPSGRKETLARFKEQFNKSYKGKENNLETLEIADAAILCAIVCSEAFPNWGKKELEEFSSNMETNMHLISSIIGKEPNQARSILLNKLSETISNSIKGVKTVCVNKSKEKESSSSSSSSSSSRNTNPTGSCGRCKSSTRFTSEARLTPEERLLKFIESL